MLGTLFYEVSMTSRFLPALFVVLASSNNVLAQISDKQFTVATVQEHFRLQAMNGDAFSYPILELQSESRDGHFGRLRTGKDNRPEYRTVNVKYRLNNQTPEGSVVFVDYDMPAFTQTFSVPSHGPIRTVSPPPRKIPAEKKTEGPFLFVDPELAKLPPGATFDPAGLWVLNGVVAVNIAKDLEIVRREIWKIEKLKPDVVTMPVHPAIFTDSARKWKSSTGKFLFEGIFLDRDEQKKSVRIYTTDGKTSETPFFDLHLSDRKWVTDKVTDRESKTRSESAGNGKGGGSSMQQSVKERRK